MSPEPQDPSARPGRIIVPGAEPESPADQPRIVTPGDAEPEATAEKPRIVLPPGVARETEEEVPERPRLRPLVLVPVSDGTREALLVTDPLGVIRGQPVLGIESIAILQLLDGSVSLNDITAALMRDTKDIRVANMVRDFVARLDQLLMLDSPRFEAAYRELRDSYRQLEIRQSAFDGRSYPAERDQLVAFLDAHFAEAESARGAAPAAPARARALLAPHLDPRRAGRAIARAYLELDRAAKAPLRVVVFGTGHALIEDRFALTRKHFETPLGRIPCDRAFVDQVAARLGDGAYHGELVHRDEHSIEFQAVYLRHRFADRGIQIVPILCGGFHGLIDEGRTPREDPQFETLIEAVREAERTLGGETVYIAGADLSHVGPRFGDPPLDARTKEEIEAIDREALAAAEKGDADGWFTSIATHQDSSRICGYAPVYATLRCAAPGPGRLLTYEQSDEKDSSMVTVASMAW
jgi:AmmeMemoRadiSam system protein B